MPGFEAMETPEYDECISRIRAWCDGKYGRRSELAGILNISPQLVSDWLSGRRELSLKDWISIKKIIRRKKTPDTKPEGKIITDHFLSELKDWCSERGKQSELSRTLGVSRQLVNDWTSGRKKVSRVQWLAIKSVMKSWGSHKK
jgi:DNA-binding transcriptional regulator YdaS (Cro superfamily)